MLKVESWLLGLRFWAGAAAAGLTGDHHGHRVSLIEVIHDNLTAVSAWVVGAEAGDLHGTVQRTGSVSWQRDTAPESLIHLDYITFGTEKKMFCFIQRLYWEAAGFTKGGQEKPANSERVEQSLKATVIGLIHDSEDRWLFIPMIFEGRAWTETAGCPVFVGQSVFITTLNL